MARRLHTCNDRLWLVMDTHPQTDGQTAVCREFHVTVTKVGGIVEGWLGHTAVLSWPDLKRSEFLVENPR